MGNHSTSATPAQLPTAPGWRTPEGTVYVRCPNCGRMHAHGVGEERPGQSAGTRVPHCKQPPWQPEYEILVIGDATPEIIRRYRRSVRR